MSKRTVLFSVLVFLLIALLAAACAPSAPQAPSSSGDPAAGKVTWAQKPCAGCHGANAEGGQGPRLAGTNLSLDRIVQTVRSGREEMPKFSADQISDKDLANIYAWLKSLPAQ
jgi:mono/diheme cytochrome c family protein